MPVAYFAAIIDKVKNMKYLNMQDQIMNYGFFAFGFLFLFLDLLCDIYYFWVNNFRTELKKIIIEVKDSTLSHKSLREIESICKRYSSNKIKSISTKYVLKNFLKRFNVV